MLQAIAYIARHEPPQAPAPRADRRAARLLRRRRPRDQDRRAGDRAVRRRRSMSGTRSSTTASSSTGCAAWARCSSRNSTRCPTAARWSFPPMACPRSVPAAAEARGLDYLDATCPLVSKVHRQAERLIEAGRHIMFIGHAGHPEVIGTFGQVPAGLDDPGRDGRGRRRCSTPADPDNLSLPDPDDAVGRRHGGRSSTRCRLRFPAILAPRSEDICYATSNRQAAVKAIAAAVRPDAGDRRAQQQQFAAPRRSRRAQRRRPPG